MKRDPKSKQTAPAPVLVPAKTLAALLSVSSRYVHMLAEQGKIPHHRFGRACIRFSTPDVFRALGINPEAAAVAGANQ